MKTKFKILIQYLLEELRITLLIVILAFRYLGKKSIRLTNFFDSLINKLDPKVRGTIRRHELIKLSLQNLTVKKVRSLVTIGGMAIGIGIVVFLVSLGYGLESLVISRIAKLDELKQIDVTTQIGSKVHINDKALTDFKNIDQVAAVHPVISAVGKVNFQNSESAIVLYGATSDYLDTLSHELITGQKYSSNELINEIPTEVKETNSMSLDNVKIEIQEDTDTNITTKTLAFKSQETREIIVNKTVLKLIGLTESNAIDQIISINIVIVGNVLEQQNQRIESTPIKYKIVAIINDDSEPIAYIPFIELRSLGITNYSTAKVVLENQAAFGGVRNQINAYGFVTTSVIDTVKQVTDLFATLRIVLGSVGMIALVIAGLGMFNTLTVTLLERTREIGLMKTMGMKSNEIQNMFLTESLIIATAGGFFGLILGFVLGKLTGLVLTILTMRKNQGFLDVSSIPLEFVILIGILSLIMGLLTGIYPARRATKISALNALRYE